MFEDGAYGGDGGQPMSSPTESTQPSLRRILLPLLTSTPDTTERMERQLLEAEQALLTLITTAKPEKQYNTMKANGFEPGGKRHFEPAESIMDVGYNKALDEYEAALLAKLKGEQ
jgi:hypothetical protein